MPNTTRYRPRDIGFSIRSSSIAVYAWYRGRFCCLLLLGFIDSGLRLVSNSLSSFGVFFLARGLVIPLAIGVVGCSLALLLLLIDSCINVIKSNTGISFVVSCSSSGITSGNNSCIVGTSIGLIGRYLDVTLCVVVGSVISSWIIIIFTGALIESSYSSRTKSSSLYKSRDSISITRIISLASGVSIGSFLSEYHLVSLNLISLVEMTWYKDNIQIL
jgi:hypothetical protein